MADEKMAPKSVKVGDVLAKDKTPKLKTEPKPKASEKKPKAKHRHTHIEHHYDEAGKESGHTVRHTPQGGGEEVSYAAPDLDAVHDGLEQHVGEPNGDEQTEAQPNPMAQQQPQPTPQAV